MIFKDTPRWSFLTLAALITVVAVMHATSEGTADFAETNGLGQACAAPSRPTRLAVTLDGATAGLSWNAPSAGTAASSYVLEVGATPGATDVAILETGGAGRSLDVHLPAGRSYVRVRASNDCGMSRPSNERLIVVSAQATSCATLPGPPTSLQALVTGGSRTFSWDAPTSGGGVISYVFERGSAPGTADLGTILVQQTSLTIPSPPGSMYARVRARTECGLSSTSNEVVVSPLRSRQRHATDRPDELSGYQAKVLYVLPSDGQDQQLDTNGVIDRSVAAFQAWFERQGGRRVRIDTFQGLLDITFVRLNRTDASIKATGAFVRDELERELRALGLDDPHKIYAIYYGGGSTFACGGGAWPPTLIGDTAALYLLGTPPGAQPCSLNEFAQSADTPGYWEFGMLHELLHTVGVVATCAPTHTLSGHVSDDPRDLMWAGNQPWVPSLLDVNRNDYFRSRPGRCLDLQDSVFMTPMQLDAERPPGSPMAMGSQPTPSEHRIGPIRPPHAHLCRLLPSGPTQP